MPDNKEPKPRESVEGEELKRNIWERLIADSKARRPPVQDVNNPISEVGVDLNPTTPGLLKVGGFISRVWATLWLWTGSNLIRSQGTVRGEQVTTPAHGRPSTTVVASGTLGGATWQVVNLGVVVQWILVYCNQATIEIETSLDGSTYQHRRITPAVGAFNVSDVYSFSDYMECQYIRVRFMTGVDAVDFTVVGENYNP